MRTLFSLFFPLILFASSYLSLFTSFDGDKRESGMYAEHSLFVDESEMFISGFKKRDEGEVREFYYQNYFDDMKINVGRKIEYFGVGNTHNLLQFLGNSKKGTDREDREFHNIGSDGIAISKEFYGSEVLFNLYIKKREGGEHNLLKLSKSFERSLLEVYLSEGNQKNSIGFNYDIEFLEEYIFYLEGKKREEIDSLIGLKYTPSSEITFLVEGVAQNSGESKSERLHSLINLTQEKRDEYFGTLQSKEYLNFGGIYREDDLTLTGFLYKNMLDNSQRLILQGEYVYNNFKFTLRHIENSGEEFSEFADSLDDSNYFFLGFNRSF